MTTTKSKTLFKTTRHYGYGISDLTTWRTGWVIALAALVVLGLIMALMVPLHFAHREECRQTGEAMNVRYRHGFYTGCLIEGRDGWLPLDQLRGEEGFER